MCLELGSKKQTQQHRAIPYSSKCNPMIKNYELQWTTTINNVQDCYNISLPVATYPWFGWRSDLYQVHICLVLCMQLWTQHAILTMRPLILPSVTTTSPYNHHWSNWSWNSQIYQHIQENQWKSQYITKYYLKSYIWLQNTKFHQYFITNHQESMISPTLFNKSQEIQ